ncbi:MAG TPA: M50 family metallopeptidase [Phycisphaerae bacterium]|nr:M50 family metallopeptidase [Phycisphaerae bacterium]
MTAVDIIAPARCARCGLQTSAAGLLSLERKFFSAQVHPLCPVCRQRGLHRFWTICVWTMRSLGLICLAQLIVAIRRDTPLESTGDFLWLWTVIGFSWGMPLWLLAHELGHLTACLVLGIRIYGLELGRGRAMWAGNIGPFFLRIRSQWIAGRCYCSFLGHGRPGWRRMLMIAAGPLANATLAAIAIPHLRGNWPIGGYRDIAHGIWWAIFLPNAALTLGNLFPRRSNAGGVRFATDGAQLIAPTDSLLTETMRANYDLEQCMLTGRHKEAQQLATILSNQQPRFSVLLPYLARTQGWPAVAAHIRTALEYAKNEEERYALYAWLAVADVYSSQNPQEADDLSAQCLARQPWEPSVKAVRAAVLFAAGKPQQALPLLRACRRRLDPWTPAGIATAWLSADWSRHSADHSGHASWQRRARRFDPDRIYQLPPPPHESPSRPLQSSLPPSPPPDIVPS